MCLYKRLATLYGTKLTLSQLILKNHTFPVKLFHAPLGEEHKILSTFHGIPSAPKAPMYFVIQDILSISQSIILHTEKKSYSCKSHVRDALHNLTMLLKGYYLLKQNIYLFPTPAVINDSFYFEGVLICIYSHPLFTFN